MPDQQPSASALEQASEHFYSSALRRIGGIMAVLAPLLIAAAWWKFGVRAAIGFTCGCAIAYVNFHWLKRVIAGFVDRATGAATSQSGQGTRSNRRNSFSKWLIRASALSCLAWRCVEFLSPASCKAG